MTTTDPSEIFVHDEHGKVVGRKRDLRPGETLASRPWTDAVTSQRIADVTPEDIAAELARTPDHLPIGDYKMSPAERAISENSDRIEQTLREIERNAPTTVPFEPSKAARYAYLKRQKTQLETEVSDIGTEMDRLQDEILEMLAAHGVPRIPVDGWLVHPIRRVWAQKASKAVTTEDVCAALIAAGHPEFVKAGYNSQTVSSWLSDLDKNNEPLPPELDGILISNPTVKLGVRRDG